MNFDEVCSSLTKLTKRGFAIAPMNNGGYINVALRGALQKVNSLFSKFGEYKDQPPISGTFHCSNSNPLFCAASKATPSCVGMGTIFGTTDSVTRHQNYYYSISISCV